MHNRVRRAPITDHLLHEDAAISLCKLAAREKILGMQASREGTEGDG